MPFGAARLAFLAKTSLTVEAVVYRSEVKITPVNTAQVDTANSKFGGASLALDGSNDYLQCPSPNNIDDSATDFTFEGWFRFDINPENQTIGGGSYMMLATVSSNSYILCQESSGKRSVQIAVSGTYMSFTESGGAGWSINTWYHIAVVRNSDQYDVYIDGVALPRPTTSTKSGGWAVGGTLTIGRFIDSRGSVDGYIDELRISDIARYTSNFTTQTQPHQNDDNTLLLMHMDGKDADKGFVDDPGYDLLLDTVVFESETTALGTQSHSDWHWKSDGTSFHAVDRSADAVYNYSLTTAFDASTATQGTSKSISSFDINPRGIALNPEGTIMIVCGDGNNKLFEFDLSTAFDVTSWSSSSDDFTLNGSNLTSRGILWNDDGTELYVLNSGPTQIFAYTTTTPYSLSGMSFNTSVSHTLDNNSVIAMNWANSGYTLLVTNDSTDDLYSFRCNTPYDATTSEFRAQISMNSPSSAGVQVDETNQKILVYDISDDDISTYSYG